MAVDGKGRLRWAAAKCGERFQGKGLIWPRIATPSWEKTDREEGRLSEKIWKLGLVRNRVFSRWYPAGGRIRLRPRQRVYAG